MSSATVLTCKQSPEKVLFILIIIDVVCSTVSAIFYGFLSLAVIFTAGSDTTAEILIDYKFINSLEGLPPKEATGVVKKTGYLLFLIVILDYMLELYLFRLIRDGMKIDHFRMCKKWLAIRVLIFVVTLAFHAYFSIAMVFSLFQIPSFLFLVYACYELAVGMTYIKDLNNGITFHGNPPEWQRPKWQVP